VEFIGVLFADHKKQHNSSSAKNEFGQADSHRWPALGLRMLPSHRIMRHGKQVYDDDDKYNKYDKPWTTHQTWRQVRSSIQGARLSFTPPPNRVELDSFYHSSLFTQSYSGH
jgi:hypothetical protein